ncbi:MAG: deoxyribose-phosphate aldolase [Verrucomicrobia bacterium]|nr:deoxyribose-phosphate aldolase [Verrucomicrobiota bacterium]
MNHLNIASTIDHTLLSPEATAADIDKLCDEARQHHFFSVCIPPCWVPHAKKRLAGSEAKVVTVISFPHGNDLSSSKAVAAKNAQQAGADEIDMVMNLGLAKAGDWTAVEKDISEVVQAVRGIPVKVILETCLLSQDQIEKACQAATKAGAKFVKTSTGYSKSGATVEAVRLMCASVPASLEVKASGGIRDAETAQKMLEAGATRLGTSSGVAIVSGKTSASSY